nr:phosphatase PAP2 family protein [Actinomadura rubrisoli]
MARPRCAATDCDHVRSGRRAALAGSPPRRLGERGRAVRAPLLRPERYRPDRDAQSGRPRRKRPLLVGELLIVFLLLEVYGYIRSLANTRYGAALAHGRDILSIERHLHLDIELEANRWLTHHDTLSRIAVNLYQHTHTGLTMTVLLCCYIFGPGTYRPARNALVLINLVGLAVFFVLPVMPPRLLPDEGFTDTVALAGYGTTHQGPVAADQYAAMPSLHLAWAMWVMAVAMAVLRPYRVRWLAVLHPATTAIVIVVTANHYLLDVLAGALVAMAAVLATGLIWVKGRPIYDRGQPSRPELPDPQDRVEPGHKL